MHKNYGQQLVETNILKEMYQKMSVSSLDSSNGQAVIIYKPTYLRNHQKVSVSSLDSSNGQSSYKPTCLRNVPKSVSEFTGFFQWPSS